MSDTQLAKLSSRHALLFQASIVLVAVIALAVSGIQISTAGLPVGVALLLGSLGGVVTYPVFFSLAKLEVFFPSTVRRHVRELYGFAAGYSWWVLIALTILAGVGEELLFRGVLQGWLTEAGGHVTGVVLASVVFGLLHYLSFAYFLVATVLGAILGMAYLFSESILLVMAWHTAYDLTAVFVLRRFPSLFGLSENEN